MSIKDPFHPTMEELRSEMDKAEVVVCKICAGIPSKNLTTMVFSVCAVKHDSGLAKQEYISALFPTMDEDRFEMFYEYGRHMVVDGTLPLILIMVTEAWISTSDTPEIEVMPSDHPERREVICIVGSTYTGEMIGRTYPLYRTEDGDMVIARGEKKETDKFMEARLIAAIFAGTKDAISSGRNGEPVVINKRYKQYNYDEYGNKQEGFPRRGNIHPTDGTDV